MGSVGYFKCPRLDKDVFCGETDKFFPTNAIDCSYDSKDVALMEEERKYVFLVYDGAHPSSKSVETMKKSFKKNSLGVFEYAVRKGTNTKLKK